MNLGRNHWINSLRRRIATRIRGKKDRRRNTPIHYSAIEVLEDRTLLSNISIGDATAVETASGQTAFTFVVTRDANTADETVTYTTNNGTATTADGDFDTASGTLSFTNGGALTMNITVIVNGDTKVEADETFTVDIINSSGGAVITDQQGLGTITNDDTANLTIGNVTVTEGNSGTVFAVFQVTLNNAVQGGVNVNYATVNGTATAGTDFTAAGGTLSFAGTVGETVAVPVIVNGDVSLEANETFTMALTGIAAQGAGVNSANITAAGSPATGTITNDDGAAISINDVTAVETLAGSTIFAFSVTLNQAVGSAFTVNYATANGTAIAGSDYFASSGTLNFTGTLGEVQTIAVLVIGDGTIESDETFFVNLSAATFGVTISDAQGIGTITNDDLPIPATPSLTAPIGTTYDNTPTFTWTAATGALTYELLVYNTATGQAVVNQTGIVGTSFTPTTPLQQATHQAFVRAVNNTGTSAYSAVLNFSAALNIPTFATATMSTIDSTPTISWNALTGAATYEVLVYNIVLGKQVVHQAGIATTSFTPTSAFASVDHQVFIRAFDAFGSPSPYSAAQTIFVGSGTPTLTAPGPDTNDTTPTFEWDPVNGAASYELIVYDLSTTQAVITQTNIVGTQYTPTTPLEMKSYQAFVRAVDGGGNEGAYSAGLEFTIVLPATTVTGPTSNINSTTPTITWNAVTGADTYELLLYNTTRGQLIASESGITPTQYTTPTLGQGEHQVFVRAVDADGNKGLYSTSYLFNVVIGAPTLTSPQISSNDTTPTFTWTSVAGAVAYELIVYNVDTGALDGALTNITATTYTQATPVVPGNYQTFVRALDALNVPGPWSAGRNFEIIDNGSALLEAPIFTSPLQSSPDTTPTFGWTTVGGAVAYELLVYNVTTGQLVGAQTNIFALNYTFPTPAPPGSYQAFVRALDSNATGGFWSAPFNFQITAAEATDSHGPAQLPEEDAAPNADPLSNDELKFVSIDAPIDATFSELTEERQQFAVAKPISQEVDAADIDAIDVATESQSPVAGIDAVLAAWPETGLWDAVIENEAALPVVDSRMDAAFEPVASDAGIVTAGAAFAWAGHKLLTRSKPTKKVKTRRRKRSRS